jgi:hypothetical protein
MISPQWVNIDDEGALHVLLQRLASTVPVDSIDALWILPTRRSTGIESTVVILSVFDSVDPLRRRVGAVRWLVTRDRKGRATVEEQMNEYASAPADALQRIVEGVMRRLGDNSVEPAQPRIIAGDAREWSALLRSLGAPETAVTEDVTPEVSAGYDPPESSDSESDAAPGEAEGTHPPTGETVGVATGSADSVATAPVSGTAGADV